MTVKYYAQGVAILRLHVDKFQPLGRWVDSTHPSFIYFTSSSFPIPPSRFNFQQVPPVLGRGDLVAFRTLHATFAVRVDQFAQGIIVKGWRGRWVIQGVVKVIFVNTLRERGDQLHQAF